MWKKRKTNMANTAKSGFLFFRSRESKTRTFLDVASGAVGTLCTALLGRGDASICAADLGRIDHVARQYLVLGDGTAAASGGNERVRTLRLDVCPRGRPRSLSGRGHALAHSKRLL